MMKWHDLYMYICNLWYIHHYIHLNETDIKELAFLEGVYGEGITLLAQDMKKAFPDGSMITWQVSGRRVVRIARRWSKECESTVKLFGTTNEWIIMNIHSNRIDLTSTLSWMWFWMSWYGQGTCLRVERGYLQHPPAQCRNDCSQGNKKLLHWEDEILGILELYDLRSHAPFQISMVISLMYLLFDVFFCFRGFFNVAVFRVRVFSSSEGPLK